VRGAFIPRDGSGAQTEKTGMNKKAQIEVIEGSGNVYADLGFRDADAMKVKAGLVTKIEVILKKRRLTQIQAAQITGLPQPRLSAILRGHFHNVSERKLLDCLTALGQDVKIVVTPARRGREGTLTVAA
jgi:predicted XRE-type DNA-binding protein